MYYPILLQISIVRVCIWPTHTQLLQWLVAGCVLSRGIPYESIRGVGVPGTAGEVWHCALVTTPDLPPSDMGAISHTVWLVFILYCSRDTTHRAPLATFNGSVWYLCYNFLHNNYCKMSTYWCISMAVFGIFCITYWIMYEHLLILRHWQCSVIFVSVFYFHILLNTYWCISNSVFGKFYVWIKCLICLSFTLHLLLSCTASSSATVWYKMSGAGLRWMKWYN